MEFITAFDIDDAQLTERIRQLGHDSIEAYQRWHGLTPDGWLGPVTTSHLNRPRCCLPDILPKELLEKSIWTVKEITAAHRMTFPSLTSAQVNLAYTTAMRRWSEVCGLNIQVIPTFDEANIYSESGTIDGPGGTLAYAYLPEDSPASDQLQQMYDVRDMNSYDVLLEVITHETGHSIGLGHNNNTSSIMHPYIMGNRQLSPDDIESAIRLYGPATSPPIPPVPPPGEVSRLVGPIEGETWAFIGYKLD